MSEERLQEIKDSINLQYQVQEANDLNNFNIFTDEEQELVEEIERLNNIINELSKENQELKEKTKLFHKNGVFSLEYDKETLKDMVLEYQEKIDKAIEYINENWGHWCSNHCKYATETINILKGSDK